MNKEVGATRTFKRTTKVCNICKYILESEWCSYGCGYDGMHLYTFPNETFTEHEWEITEKYLGEKTSEDA